MKQSKLRKALINRWFHYRLCLDSQSTLGTTEILNTAENELQGLLVKVTRYEIFKCLEKYIFEDSDFYKKLDVTMSEYGPPLLKVKFQNGDNND